MLDGLQPFWWRTCLACCVLLFMAPACPAETIEARLPNGLHASADFHESRSGLPAILLIPGFLQTRHALTVSHLAGSLASQGFATLVPTLTLGIDYRRENLACEAIHTHSMAADLREMDYWVQWLAARGYKKIVLAGHSYGAVQTLAYLSAYPAPAIKCLVAISLPDIKPDARLAPHHAHAKPAQDMLGVYTLSYCHHYLAPPSAARSYLQWTRQRILHSLRKAPVPVRVILGSEDGRMDSAWKLSLKQMGVSVTMIPGANQFFDLQHEFELADKVAEILKTLPAKP